MNWNYRVIAFKDKQEKIYFQIHEVYYNEQNIPNGYTKEPAGICGETIEEIQWTLDKMKLSLEKPVLKSWDFPNEL